MNLSQRAKEIIATIKYITIASVDEHGMPWNAPVFAAYDADYNFYWGTSSASQKSQNIKHNKNIFIVIYDSTAPAGTGEGVYIKATARELNNTEEIILAHKLLSERDPAPYWDLEKVQGSSPIRLYKATVEKTWMNGEGESDGTYVDTRVEVQLPREPMKHRMQLQPSPFKQIQAGTKYLEIRLYDEKRRNMRVGDTIEFHNALDPNDLHHKKIVAMTHAKSLLDLFQQIPLETAGWPEGTLPEKAASHMRKYYSEEEETMFGAVALHLG